MKNKLSFRSYNGITVEGSQYQENNLEIDFPTAISVFKDEYMRDNWSKRTLNFHLENLAAFCKYLSLTGNRNLNVPTRTLEDFIKTMRKDLRMNTINGTNKNFTSILSSSKRIRLYSIQPGYYNKNDKG